VTWISAQRLILQGDREIRATRTRSSASLDISYSMSIESDNCLRAELEKSYLITLRSIFRLFQRLDFYCTHFLNLKKKYRERQRLTDFCSLN